MSWLSKHWDVKAGVDQLDPMTRHYLVTALWSSTDDSGNNLDANYDIENIAPSSIQKAQQDCDAFSREIAEWIRQIPQGVALDQIGHDFWLTRNGHGAGFWDRPEMYGGQENADRISDIARKFGEVNPVVGDDGQIYIE